MTRTRCPPGVPRPRNLSSTTSGRHGRRHASTIECSHSTPSAAPPPAVPDSCREPTSVIVHRRRSFPKTPEKPKTRLLPRIQGEREYAWNGYRRQVAQSTSIDAPPRPQEVNPGDCDESVCSRTGTSVPRSKRVRSEAAATAGGLSL